MNNENVKEFLSAMDKEWRTRCSYITKDKVIEMVEFYYSVARAFICHQITQAEYKVYLCILNNLKNGKSCTLEKMGITLNMEERNILRAIQSLEKASLLRVDRMVSSEKGIRYNMYHPMDTDVWDKDTDIELDENAIEWKLKLIA